MPKVYECTADTNHLLYKPKDGKCFCGSEMQVLKYHPGEFTEFNISARRWHMAGKATNQWKIGIGYHERGNKSGWTEFRLDASDEFPQIMGEILKSIVNQMDERL